MTPLREVVEIAFPRIYGWKEGGPSVMAPEFQAELPPEFVAAWQEFAESAEKFNTLCQQLLDQEGTAP
jgi:hypothetical protein